MRIDTARLPARETFNDKRMERREEGEDPSIAAGKGSTLLWSIVQKGIQGRESVQSGDLGGGG